MNKLYEDIEVMTIEMVKDKVNYLRNKVSGLFGN